MRKIKKYLLIIALFFIFGENSFAIEPYEFVQQTADEASEALDPILSGRYLITQLRHKIDINAGTHVMVVTAMKDSVIKQTEALKLFNFPEPPQIPSMKIPELPKMPRPKLPSFKFPKITFGGFSSLF